MRNGELNLELGAGDELRCDQPCPHCEATVAVPLWRIGRRGQCPSCRQEFRATCTPDFLDELPEQLRRVLVLCEHCHAEYVSPIELLGVRTRCQACQRRFRRRLLREHIDFRGNGHARVACPQCQENFVIRRSKLGKNSRCQKCGESFMLAERESSTGSGFLDQAVSKPGSGRPRPQPKPHRKPKQRRQREPEPLMELPLPPQEPAAPDDDLLKLIDQVAPPPPEASLEALAADVPDLNGEPVDPCDGTEVLAAVVETDDDAPLPLDDDEPVQIITPDAEVIRIDHAPDDAPGQTVEQDVVADASVAVALEDEPLAAEPLEQAFESDRPEIASAPEAEPEAEPEREPVFAACDDSPVVDEVAQQPQPEREEPEAADIDDPLAVALEEPPVEAHVEHALAEPTACHPESDVAIADGACHASGLAEACDEAAAQADAPAPSAVETLHQPPPRRGGLLSRLKRAIARDQAEPQPLPPVQSTPHEAEVEQHAAVDVNALDTTHAPSPPLAEMITLSGDLSSLTLEPVADAIDLIYTSPHFDLFDRHVVAPAAEASDPDAAAAEIPSDISNFPLAEQTAISHVESVNDHSPPQCALNIEPAQPSVAPPQAPPPDSSPLEAPQHVQAASLEAEYPAGPEATETADTLSFDDAMAELEQLATEEAPEAASHAESEPKPDLEVDLPAAPPPPSPATAQVTMKSVSLEHVTACRGHTRPVFSVDVSADGTTAISGGLDGVLRLWNTADGTCTRELSAGAGIIWRVALFDDTRKAVSAHEDGVARIWDLAESMCIAKAQGPADHVQSVCFSADGRQMLAGDAAGMLSLIDLNSAAPRRFKGHQGRMTAAKFARADRAITAGEDNLVRIWDVATLRCTALLEGHAKPPRAVAMDDSGTLAASGGDDCTVRIWDVATGKCRLVLQPADKRINALWLSADGKLLACGGDDGVLRLYDTATGNLLHEARDHRLWISALSAEAKGVTLVSAGWDLLLNVYRMDV